MSFSEIVVSSFARGEKWQTTLLMEMHVGNATPLSIFFLAFLYTLPVCLQGKELLQIRWLILQK
jgi:hypothetical protein